MHFGKHRVSNRNDRIVSAFRVFPLALLLAIAGCFGPQLTGNTRAASPPTTIDSWYVGPHWYTYYGGGASVFYNYGHGMANGGESVLDWGVPCIDGNGAWSLSSFEYGCQSQATVKSELSSIKSGYDANSSHTQTRILAIGIDNNSTCINTGCPSGINYDNVGTTIAQLIDSVGNGSHIQFWGAADIEPDWSAQYGVSESVSMGIVDGWNYQEYGHANRQLFDFGALEESGYNSSTHTPSYGGGWTAAEQNKLNWTGELELSFLEEYNTNFPTYLGHLDQYSYYDTSYGAWVVYDVLAGQGFLNPDTSWQDTLNALNADSHTSQSYIDYLSNMQTLS